MTTPGEVVTERAHPLTPLARSWIALIVIVLFVGRSVLDNGMKLESKTLPAVAIFAGVWLAWSIVRGFFEWRFTRFVIDHDQVRIDRRFITHTSERISFTKIQSVNVLQPFAARVLRLAALEIDVGDHASGTSIEFLSKPRALELRDYLMSRARGHATTTPTGEAITAPADTSQVIVRLSPQRLIVAAVTRFNFVAGIVVLVAVIISGTIADALAPALGGTFAIVLMLARTIIDSVVKQWNYTLWRTDSGVRVSRGATDLASTSVPIDRIQGISISQGLLWRALGLSRVEMTVLGTKIGELTSGESTLLLPAGRAAEVNAALTAVWPEFDLDSITLHPASPRARWLHPFKWRTLTWGFNDTVLVTRGGVVKRITAAVPHARVQSVALHQGPLRRRLGLATVSAHITLGPVDLDIRGLDAATARELALTEMDRCRAARRRDRATLVPEAPPIEPPVPETRPASDAEAASAASPGAADDWPPPHL